MLLLGRRGFFVSGKIFGLLEIYVPAFHSRLEEIFTLGLGLWPCATFRIESDATCRH
jgi:hypothetical protein